MRLVAQQDPDCSDQGPGSASVPFCSISAAAKASSAGDTVNVAAGTYRELVRAPAGVTFNATTSAAVVTGANSLASATWSATAGNAWTTPLSAKAVVTQVFRGSTLLRKVSAADQTSANTWFYDSAAHLLYVDLGGPAPTAADALEVSVRSYGFLVRQVGGVTVRGFTLRRQGVAGVQLDHATGSLVDGVTVTDSASYGVNDTGGSHDRITGVRATRNASIGVRLNNTTSSAVTSSTTQANGFHGISVQASSGARVAGNTSSANSSPTGRKATGIDVSQASVGAVVERNVTFGNDDSGIEIYTGSTGAVVRRNVSYDNGDHGVDVSNSEQAVVVSNTVFHNTTSGLNVEGGSADGSVPGSINATLRDNISVDNAVNTSRSKGGIRVDKASVPGTTIDRDLVFQSDGKTPLFEWSGVLYTSLSTFRSASGQEAHGMVVDPEFVDPAGRNLQLGPTSPALDAAASSAPGWVSADQTGAAPVDQPDVADTGTGPITYADLGALERTTLPPDFPPVAALSVSPSTVDAGQAVTLDASASTDDHGITSYAFVCDTGGPVTTKTSPTTTCTYSSGGTRHPAVTVTDGRGQTSSASKTVTVTVPPTAPTAALTATPSTVPQGVAVTLNAGGSQPGQGATLSTYVFTCGTQAAMAPQTSSTATCRFSTVGNKTVQVLVKNNLGLTDTASAVVQVTTGTPPTARLTLKPTRVRLGRAVHADASASTGTAVSHITGYRFRCGKSTPTAWSTRSASVCRFHRIGRMPVTVWVRSNLGLVDRAVKWVRVRR